uniref:LisH domain-containing protein n=1 Tax=Meloidogyne incognita TaxID=6306 RepID=A0A914L653_MELIC
MTNLGMNNNNQAALDAQRNALQDELREFLDTWINQNENADWDVNPLLRRIAELLEESTNEFMQNNPDPMDDRHPLKSQPSHPLGHLLKMITRVESFVNKLVISYLIARDNIERNVLAARLIINLLPGIDTNVVLADADSLITQLFRWAEHSESRELRTYSMALLGAAMGAEQAHQYRQNNTVLIPIALQRLRALHAEMLENNQLKSEESMAGINQRNNSKANPTNFAHMRESEKQEKEFAFPLKPLSSSRKRSVSSRRIDGVHSPPPKRLPSSPTSHNDDKQDLEVSSEFTSCSSATNNVVSPSSIETLKEATGYGISYYEESPGVGCNSNSSWRQTMQPIIVGTHKLFPLSIEMEQRLILHYLGPTSEYQDNLSIVLEHHALDVVLSYLAVDGYQHTCRDIRLLFDAIRYISSLLIHRKFAWEFISAQGIQKLLKINRQSLALTAVATCLYYLAYSSDIMEKVCHLPDSLLNEMVDYSLYALDHSHESGRASIAMFLAYALQFRAILDRFDQRDGLRRLYNYVSTLTILQRNDIDEDDLINDEHYIQSIATIKNAIFAFRTYLSSHVFLKMENMKQRSQLGKSSHHMHYYQGRRVPAIPHAIPNIAHPHSKPMALDEETEKGCIEYLLRTQCMLQPHHHNWKPVEDMRVLGVFRLLFTLISKYPDWCHWERQGKADTLKLVLEVLRLATVSPKVQLDSCETMMIRHTPMQGLGLILEMADGELINDSQIQRLSLEILNNCLCSPTDQDNYLGLHYRFTCDFDRDILPKELSDKLSVVFDKPNEVAIVPTAPLNSNAVSLFSGQRPLVTRTSTIAQHVTAAESTVNKDKGVKLFLVPTQILHILWKCAQQNNAIMVLTSLLHKQSPATEADLIRELACRALNGVARFEPIRQILSKLPIIAANELNALMQTPILLEKRIEHNRFCDQARHLIECVSQTKLQDFTTMTMEMTQENLWRSAVVAQTRIKFNEKELLQLIYQHLTDIGFKKTARQLQTEAELPNFPASRIPSTPASLPGFPRQNPSSFANVIARRILKFDANNAQIANNGSTAETLPTSIANASSTRYHSTLTNNTTIIGNRIPMKIHLSTTNTPTAIGNSVLPFSSASYSDGRTPLGQSLSTSTPGPSISTSSISFSLKVRPHKSLSDIVHSYFRNEHAMCRNPVANCPPFSLFYPHRCPEPKLLYSPPSNFVNRLRFRSNPPYRCTMEALRREDRRLVFSKFRQSKTFIEENETFTCCQLSHNDEHVFLGTYAGEMFVFNIRTGVVDSSYTCHHSSITSIRPTKNRLMLTSSAFVKPFSILWRLEANGISMSERLTEFKEDQFVEFGNLSNNQIVGTQGPKAFVYDTETSSPVVVLFDERLANHYTRNHAYFDPMDELILNDGILFDPRIGPHARVVHKFDKMNLDNSGIFHPRGTEVIINREVWDLRTRRLMHTVPALNQCQLAFNPTGSIMFGIVHQDAASEIDDRFFHIFGNFFRTFDSTNYEVISTHDTRKPLLDLCTSHSDNFVGVVEISRNSDEDTNLFKLYEIGRRREVDEEDDDDQDEANPDEEEDDDIYSSSTADTVSSAGTVRDDEDDERNSDSGGDLVSTQSMNAEELFSANGDGSTMSEQDDEDNDDHQIDLGELAGAEIDFDEDDDSSYSDEDFPTDSNDDYSP